MCFELKKKEHLFRYDEDINDRVWNPLTDDDDTASISTDQYVNTNNIYEMPQVVMKTAAIPKNASAPWNLLWTIDNTSALSYVFMHFAEIQDLKANETREFSITYNGGTPWYGWFRPAKLSITTIYSQTALTSSNGEYNFTLAMTGNSTLPPLIQALEIYTVVDILQLQTDKDEGNCMFV